MSSAVPRKPKGVYKSVDGGDSWQHLGRAKIGNVGAILIRRAHAPQH